MYGKHLIEWTWLTDRISIGEEDAVPMAHLARVLGMRRRELRHAIEKARIAGVLICSSERGYFFPESLEDIKKYVFRTKARIRTSRNCLMPFIEEIKKEERWL